MSKPHDLSPKWARSRCFHPGSGCNSALRIAAPTPSWVTWASGVDATIETAEIGLTLSVAAQAPDTALRPSGKRLISSSMCAPVMQVRAVTDTRNTPSVRLLERVGMQRPRHCRRGVSRERWHGAHLRDIGRLSEGVKKLPHERSNLANLAGRGDELERRRTDRTDVTLEGRRQRRGQHGTFIQQSEQAGP